MKCQILFSLKIRKKILSAEFAHSMVNVNIIYMKYDNKEKKKAVYFLCITVVHKFSKFSECSQ